MKAKIERVEVFGVGMPLVGTFTSGGISKAVTKCVVVRLTAAGRSLDHPQPGTIERAVEQLIDLTPNATLAASRRVLIALTELLDEDDERAGPAASPRTRARC